ncbi:MAG: hypothetical protein AB2411_04290 [Mesobacillus sp.]|jgi:hypothetical protein
MSFVVLLLFIILLIVSFGSFSNRFLGSRFMSGSVITKVFAGYLTILLVAGIVSLMVPVEDTIKGKYLTDKQLAENDRLNNDIYHTVESGKIEEAEGLTKKESWDFPLNEKSLDIRAMDNSMVFIEKDKSLVGKVEVTHYSTYSYIDNIDITDRFESPDIELSRDTLKIFPREPLNIKLVKYKNAFPFTQFSEDEEQFTSGYGMMEGLDFIYIIVPADTEVSGGGYVIN